MSRAVALLVAVLAGLGVGVAPGASPVAAAGDVHLALIAQPFAVAPNSSWSATFAVTGDLGAATPGTTASGAVPDTGAVAAGPAVTARVTARRPIADASAMSAALVASPTSVASQATVPVSLTTDGDQTAFTVSVSTTADPDRVDRDDPTLLALGSAAIYPVTVELLVDGAPVASSDTFLDRLPLVPPPAAGTMNVAVVADVTDPGPTPTPTELATGRDELQAIAQSADALGGALTLRLPPVVAASLADDEPALLAALRTALAPAEVLSIPTPSLDPSAAVAAGLQDAFAQSLRTGDDLVSAVFPSSPPQRSAWLTGVPISTSGATMLREPSGFDALVFDAALYATLDGGIGGFHDWSQAFSVALAGDATLPGFVVSPVSHWLDRRELDGRGLTPTDGAVRLMAELVVRRAQDPTLQRGAVLSLAPGVAPDPEVASALASYVTEVPGFALRQLAALPAATQVMEVPGRGRETVRLPAVAGPDLSERVARVNVTRLSTASAASMLDGHAQLDEWSGELDSLLSTAVSDGEASAVLDRIDGEVRAQYDLVEAPRPFTFTLTGRRSNLRLNIHNNSPQVLHVVVRPSSPKLHFPDGDVPVDLVPNGVTEVQIPVQAQTNGTSAIGIDIVTPVGLERVQGPVVFTARVNALSGLGQVVTGAAILVLVSWWYGHFRRRRRRRRAMLGEVDNPTPVVPGSVSPDAAEAVAEPDRTTGNGDRPLGAPEPAPTVGDVPGVVGTPVEAAAQSSPPDGVAT